MEDSEKRLSQGPPGLALVPMCADLSLPVSGGACSLFLLCGKPCGASILMASSMEFQPEGRKGLMRAGAGRRDWALFSHL